VAAGAYVKSVQRRGRRWIDPARGLYAGRYSVVRQDLEAQRPRTPRMKPRTSAVRARGSHPPSHAASKPCPAVMCMIIRRTVRPTTCKHLPTSVADAQADHESCEKPTRVNIYDAHGSAPASADATTNDDLGAGPRSRGRAPHPKRMTTGALVIPIVWVNRDQLEEKRMRGSSSRRTARGWGAGNRSVLDIAAHESPVL
jgi:hypothetical protein